MKFIPRWGRIEIEPIKDESLLLSEDKKFVEKGKVIALGDDNGFCKEGDVIYFDAYGIYQTPEIDGKSHFIVRGMEFVIGKDGE
jgi:co-chaperonin GroES (HSP10)